MDRHLISAMQIHTKPNSSIPVLYHEMVRMFMKKMTGFLKHCKSEEFH